MERFHADLDVAEILRFAGDAETAVRLKRELVAIGRDNPGAVIHGIVIERSIAATLSDLAYMALDAGRRRGGASLRRGGAWLFDEIWAGLVGSRMLC